ncbi:MAG TPA: ferritin-like domain-containing protein [Bryobacteraceae bacterium]|nr:ferritin-like domain-containing protein [Bryobacteraceae bacterium]
MNNTLDHGAKNRRKFLRSSLSVGAALAGSTVLEPTLSAQQSDAAAAKLSAGDIAILRFVAAAELIEADLWQQYAELGGITTEAQNPYQTALRNLDSDGSQYITSNTLDELSHAEFLNAYLISKGAEPVDFDQFRVLPSSEATGAQQTGRLTNLTQLTVDTSWYTRYRSATNPDLGATFPQALPDLFAGQFTAIPRSNTDFSPTAHVQAIANTAAFHFGMIEQAGSSLYATLAQKVSNAQVLKIMLSIGGDEIAHFLEWVDFAGNAVSTPLAPLKDPKTGLVFPAFDTENNPLLQPNLIFPVPCEFISANLPHCSVIRPTSPGQIDALGAANGLIANGLFIGQSPEFTELLLNMARAADSAQRQL